ncbi:MAG: glycosyltransferase family A protein [Planctomycetaceae bacterium]
MSADRPRFRCDADAEPGTPVPFGFTKRPSQTHDDFEVVISNNQSSDNADEVARSFDDPPGAILRDGSDTSDVSQLGVCPFQGSRGRVRPYLCDDDAIVPSLLERVAALLDESDRDVIYWNSLSYYRQLDRSPPSEIISSFHRWCMMCRSGKLPSGGSESC